MSLERFRRTKLVTLNRQAKAYQAARAMADNHIGAVLVSDPRGLAGIVTDRDLALAVLGHGLDPTATSLSEIMSEEVVTCDIGADLAQVARLMQEHGVRRIPVTDGGRAIELVTLDDLVVEGMVGPEALRAIVTAQLEEEAPHKPAGACFGPRQSEGQGDPRQACRSRRQIRQSRCRAGRASADRRHLHALPAPLAGRSASARGAASLDAPAGARPSRRRAGPQGHHRRHRRRARQGAGPRRQGGEGALQAVCKVVAASVTAGEIAEVRGDAGGYSRAVSAGS